MTPFIRLAAICTLVISALLPSGCATSPERTEALERRQDRIDARTSARQERWRIRGEREDARINAWYDAM